MSSGSAPQRIGEIVRIQAARSHEQLRHKTECKKSLHPRGCQVNVPKNIVDAIRADKMSNKEASRRIGCTAKTVARFLAENGMTTRREQSFEEWKRFYLDQKNGLTAREIAEREGKSMGAVYQAIHRYRVRTGAPKIGQGCAAGITAS